MNRNRKKAVAASVAVGMTMVMGFSPVLAANTDISKEETVICKCGSRRNTTGDHSFRLAEEFCISRRLK